MKKTLFALEVLLMLSALPVFCGLSMARKNADTSKEQSISVPAGDKQNAEAIVLKSIATDNS
ncbi:MAG: hypothetical protein QM764_04975 [Chitinophagaceae bacterium]